MDESNFEKKPKKKVGIIIGVIAVLVLIAAVVVGVIYLNNNKKPEKIFEDIIEKVFKMEEADVRSGRVSLELSASMDTEDPDLSTIATGLSAIKLNSITELDQNKEILNQNLAVSLLGNQVISVDALIQDNKMYFYLNDLFSKYIEVDEEMLKELDLSTIFKPADKEMAKDMKQILLDGIKGKEITQEKLEDNKTTKTTLKLTEKEAGELIVKILEKYNEIYPTETLADEVASMKEDLETMEATENNAYITVYTEGAKNEVKKVEIEINIDEDEKVILEVNKTSEKTYEVSAMYNNEKVMEIKIQADDKNSGNMDITINLNGNKIALNIKYNIENNVHIEKRDTTNCVNTNSLTEEDTQEIMENVQKNEILYSIFTLISATQGQNETI